MKKIISKLVPIFVALIIFFYTNSPTVIAIHTAPSSEHNSFEIIIVNNGASIPDLG